jgi:HD superfamily phosphohydrolase
VAISHWSPRVRPSRCSAPAEKFNSDPISSVTNGHFDVADFLLERGADINTDVADIIQGTGKNNRAVVSSQFDADRLDYMQRDRLMTGSQHSAIDFVWLLANLEVAKVSYGVEEQPVGDVETFVLGPKAIYAAEAYVLGLFQLYPTVYFHKATRSAEKIFAELLIRIVLLVRDGSVPSTGLPDAHPLVRFAKDPAGVSWVMARPFLSRARQPWPRPWQRLHPAMRAALPTLRTSDRFRRSARGVAPSAQRSARRPRSRNRRW